MNIKFKHLIIIHGSDKRSVWQLFNGVKFKTKINVHEFLLKYFYLWASHFLIHKNINGMKKIFIGLSDNVVAGVEITPSADANGVLSFQGQVALKDTTSGKSANVGDPFAIKLEPADLDNVSVAIQGVLMPIVQAQLATGA